MKRVSDEDRALFLLALSGRMPKRPITKASVKKTAKLGDKPQEHPRSKAPIKQGARQVSEDEFDLFLEAIGKKPKKQSEKHVEAPVVLMPMLPIRPRKRGPGGIDGNTKRRLEKGDVAPTAKLDLHGLTESSAHGSLMTFLHAAHRRGDRLVLIVTGKGPFLDPNGYGGVLRQNVPRWLEEAPMAQIIADKRWAHKRHGGDGALYVYLKKR